MTDQPGSTRITLDRTNLMRLADSITTVAHSIATDPAWLKFPEPMRADLIEAYKEGYDCAASAIRLVAAQMPHLYGNEGYLPPLRTCPGCGTDLRTEPKGDGDT